MKMEIVANDTLLTGALEDIALRRSVHVRVLTGRASGAQ